jgi:hypothetical protein
LSAQFRRCKHLFSFEAVAVLLETLQVRFKSPKSSFGIPGIRASRPQADYDTSLHLHKAPRFRNVLLGTANVVVSIKAIHQLTK